ncbi:DEAD/DEAH box helicase [Herbaspirillum sp. 1130]|uniref:DEAD/DEAH box helicase n=1 Tax=Herbaspirillum sp. 1130 TaxID=2806562 RepID=UPI001AE48E27|nr:DEAD/DEAH box helicase [Herbaspirillum sp. 1130]MBP1315112.1 SNF2 family DNA or RNA helicase [Herbaspirillum sp. 1130]
MFDSISFPEDFDELCKSVPTGFSISARIVDPIIILDKDGRNIVAKIAGTRLLRGERQVYFAPSNRHSWVLDGTTIRPLPRDATSIFADIFDGLDPQSLRYPDAVRLMRQAPVEIEVLGSENFRKAGKVAADDFSDTSDIPNLKAKLFPYQARGVRWMWETISHTGGLVLADEMGLGKTLQIIALLMMEPPESASPALIICPTSLIANWQRELLRFAPDLTVAVHRGSERTGTYRGLQTSSVVVTTYDTMVNDIAIFSSFEWSWVICDEAQAIKNPDSGRRKAVACIPRLRTIPMTGTPVENGLLDLWSLVDFAIPGLLGSRQEFELNYPDSMESARIIGQLCDPIILKRRVVDVAGDLPDRIDVDVPLELDNALVEHYMQVRAETMARYPVAGALVATLQLQLVCAHPWLRTSVQSDPEGEDAEISPLKEFPLMNSKMERAVQLIREAFVNGKKVIVFSLFNKIGDLLFEACKSGLAYWGAINGSTAQSRRQEIIDEFAAYDGPGCLVLNPKAAGAGLNITAATVVIHFTPVWNPALESQASARAHRRGQTQPVTVYRLFYVDTVESVMVERSMWKNDLANESIPISIRDKVDTKRALDISPQKI